MNEIYLDNNATTRIDPVVAKAMADGYASGFVNPSSQHRSGQAARRVLETIRTRIVELLGGEYSGMQRDQLVITSGGSESNNLAIRGLAANQPGGRVLISAIEHPSVTGAAEQLAHAGFAVEKIPVDQNGVVDLNVFDRMIEEPTTLVSVMLANNETGVLQPVDEIARRCRAKNIFIHTDAVQAVAKMPVNFRELEVDALSLTAHKFHGPRGVGGLLVRHGVPIEPIMVGGFQQAGLRPGTEDVVLAMGMKVALEQFCENAMDRFASVDALRHQLESLLAEEFDDLVINGAAASRAPHTSNLCFPGVDRQSLLMAADMAGLAISAGSACASGSSEPSPVLLAMGLDSDVVESSVRISLSAQSDLQQVKEAVARISRIIHNFRAKNSTQNDP